MKIQKSFKYIFSIFLMRNVEKKIGTWAVLELSE